MRYLMCIILILGIASGSLFAQKHFNNWYFGEKAGITFNTRSGEPVALLDGVLSTNEGCSSISDNDGRLLFYTDGITVWNRTHKVMKNGDSLEGHSSSAQSALIVPKPGSDCLYYIFTVGAGSWYYNPPEKGIMYSIVDMTSDNTLGEIKHKNIPILYTNSERLAATVHENGKDIWIVATDMENNEFVSYLLTAENFNSTPVISKFNNNLGQIGIMKFSPDGKKIALTSTYTNFWQIYRFDDSSGLITNETTITMPNVSIPYGLEFSTNGEFVYVSAGNISKKEVLFQFNVTFDEAEKIISSGYKVYEAESNKYMVLQMGPNDKIYVTVNRNEYLSVINEPNQSGKECNFILDAVYLGGKFSMIGLPSVVQNYNPSIKNCPLDNIVICSGDTLHLLSAFYSEAIYEWSGPNGFKSNIWNPVLKNTTPDMSGEYYCRMMLDDIELNSTINVIVHNSPQILFSDMSEIIANTKTYKLKAVENPEKTKFIWYGIDSDENEVSITKSGRYSVVAENEGGCSDSASVIIYIYPRFCAGDDIILDSQYKESDNPTITTEYLWFGPNNFTSTERYPLLENANENMSGDYYVRITTTVGSGGFIGERDTINLRVPVYVYGNLGLELFASKLRICDNDSTEIFSLDSYAEYLWSTGETSPYINVKEAGIYQLIAKNEFGCADTAEIEIFKYDANIVFDKDKIIFDELCVGDSQIENLQFKIETETEFPISDISTTSNSFEIVNYNSLIKSYKNGDIVNIEIKFKPKDAGVFEDELVISSSEPCEFVQTIPISAAAKQIIEFSIDEIYSEAGKSIEIPLHGEIKCPAPPNLTTDYEIEIAIDKEYFAPESVKFGNLIQNEIIGNERILKIKADGDFSKIKSEINVIYGKALLGRSELSQIRIADVKLARDRYFPEYINGSLNVDGCLNDITTIQMFAPTRMKISPNPTDGELKVSIATQEQGSFRLVIYDVQGREVYRTEFAKSDKAFEQKDFKINTQNLGKGFYTIHLTAPWTLLMEQVVVVR